LNTIFLGKPVSTFPDQAPGRRERADPVIKLNAKQRWIAGSSPAMTNEDVGEVTGSPEES
jgi:hypothetical protein